MAYQRPSVWLLCVCVKVALSIALCWVADSTLAQQEPQGPTAEVTDLPPEPIEEGEIPSPPGFNEGAADRIPSPPGFGSPDDLQLPDGLTGPDPFTGITDSSGQIPAQQALQQQGGPQVQGDVSLANLAQGTKMLGDFFGTSNTSLVVGQQTGMAVHQTIASGSAFANDNLSLVTTDGGTGRTVFVGGPAGLATGSFFLPSIDPSDLGAVVTGLTGNGTDGSDVFTAVLTSDLADVFDDPSDASASIPNAEVYNIFQIQNVIVPVGNPGDIVGRVRIQDNNSALPQDRLYFDYNYFHNARFSSNGFGVNRIVPGIEKTVLGGMGSIEVRVPMAVTLNSEMSFGAPIDTSNFEMGNVTITPKLLLWSSDEELFAAGMGVALPTADDLNFVNLLRVDNDSVHLIPFLAYLYTPRQSDYFVHAFLTCDFDTRGNDVQANVTGNGLESIGVYNDQTLVSASGSVGKFFYRNNSRSARVKAMAWTTELHYTSTVTNADFITAGAFQVGPESGANLNLLNGTVGAHARLQKSTVTAGYTVPINSNERLFDGEFRLFINRPF